MKQIRLSESAQELLHTCERKFQIERLITPEDQRRAVQSEYFSRGHAFGRGVQVYMITQNMNKALYQAWLAYWPEVETDRANLIRTLHCILCAKQAMDKILEDYEVVSFKGKPAAELGIRINIDSEYYFVGFLDLVLRNRHTGKYIVIDVKGTSSWKDDISVLYKNSGQVLGYSVGLDAIVGEAQVEYDIGYFVIQDSNKLPKDIKFHFLIFEKTLKDRLRWFITLGIDIERIRLMRKLNVFPLRHQGCNAFNRTCQYFGLCQVTSGDEEAPSIEDKYEKLGLYSFTYNMQDLIDNHMRRA